MSSPAGQSDVERVRDATDLVRIIGEHISLKPKGREHVGLCPFHEDHTPSFAVVTHKGHAFYKCHACGAGGDAFDFVKNYHKLEFPEALRYLADRAGIALTPRKPREQREAAHEGPSRAELREANALAAEFFQRVLQSESAGKAGRAILEDRGIGAEAAEQFMLGLAPDQWDSLLNVIRKRKLSESVFFAVGLLKQRQGGDSFYDAFRNRLIFPICNELGQPIAFGARKIDPEDEPKYLNSAESAVFQKSRTLYGLHLAKRAIIESKQAVVTEGYTDVIACHQAGLRNVVGTLGTALTKEHAAILSRLCDAVVLLFDGDEAGLRAADRGVEAFFAQPVDVRIAAIPGGLDPDDLLRQEDGANRLGAVIAGAEDALAFKVRRFRESLARAGGLSARQKQLEAFLADLAQLGFGTMQGVRKRLVLSQLSDLLGIPAQEIERAMPRARRSGGAGATGDAGARASDDARVGGADEVNAPAPVASARRRAEQELLAIAVFDCSLAQESIELETGQRGRLPDLIGVESFLDGPCRCIADRIFAFLEAGERYTMQRLLGELADERAKSLASALYFEGQRRCEQSEQRSAPLDELRAAAGALLAHIEREAYDRRVAEFHHRCRSPQSPEDAAHPAGALEAACEIIEHRRRQRTVAAAIVQGVRS